MQQWGSAPGTLCAQCNDVLQAHNYDVHVGRTSALMSLCSATAHWYGLLSSPISQPAQRSNHIHPAGGARGRWGGGGWTHSQGLGR